MSESALVLWDEGYLGYDLGPYHPLRPVRLALTHALAESLGVLDAPAVSIAAPHSAGDELLEMAHDPAYIAAVRRASGGVGYRLGGMYGLGTDDNPIFARMHEASALVAGGTLDAAQAVWRGAVQHGVNFAGGLHHAMRDRASGFCVYNDPALAICWLLANGARRVGYVDVDVHHGDGVQAAFYNDPRVLTISLHESGRTLFPGTGFADEVGGPDAAGTAVNVALPAGTGDAGWLRAFDAVVPPLLRAFGPEVLVTQHGCDSHRLDPLANLWLSLDGQRTSYAALHALAHELTGGRWVAVGGGGYQVAQVVPRAWTHLLAEAAGFPLDPWSSTPASWRETARALVAEAPPEWMTDQADVSYRPWQPGAGDPADPLDASVAATRAAVFPQHGLDPLG